MKTIEARNTSGDDWKTPDNFYNELNDIYHFDFDPCPYQSEFDGLDPECKWGGVNFINPPYSLKLKEQFVKRALEESKKREKMCITTTSIYVYKVIP